MKKLNIVFVLLASLLSLWGCGGSSSSGNAFTLTHAPQLRAVHISPDAPAVDVSIGNTLLEDVSYRQASGFLSLDSGNNNVKVLVANTSTAVIDASLDLQNDSKYTVIAINSVSNIEPLVIADDIEKPASGNSALRVVHGAPSAPPVDVYISAPGEGFSGLTPTLEDVPFKAVSDELEVPAGNYRVRITAANSSDVIYDSGTISLAAGVEYIAIAAEDENGRAPVGLTILTDLISTPFVNVDDSNARVRVVHASADAPLVDVSVDNVEVLSNVPFGTASNYIKLPSETYNIDVAASANSTSVINANLMFDVGADYTIAAVNSLSNIEPLVLQDFNTPPTAGNIKVRLIHAAPNAGSVDIYITEPDADISTLSPDIEDFNFKNNSGYIEVPAGDYRVRVALANTKTVAIDTGVLSLSSGQIRTAFALDPLPGNSNFGAVLLNDLN